MRSTSTGMRWLAAGAALGTLAGVGYLGRIWLGYGRFAVGDRRDPLLDPFIPVFEVDERHQTRVAAAAPVAHAAVMALDLNRSRLVQGLFRARELMMGARTGPGRPAPRAFLSELRDLGWGVLAEEPGRSIVMGAVTRPWQAEVVFRALPPETFAAFAEPGYVKIVWTIAVEPIGPAVSRVRTATRVVATDAEARRRFRRYWTVFSTGIVLIRRRALALIKAEAEGRARALKG